MPKVIELFAGIGSPRKALNNLNIPHEVVAFSEIDKYALEAYKAVHDDYITPNLGDIKKIVHGSDRMKEWFDCIVAAFFAIIVCIVMYWWLLC